MEEMERGREPERTVPKGKELEHALRPLFLFGRGIGILPLNFNLSVTRLESPTLIRRLKASLHGIVTISIGLNALNATIEFIFKNLKEKSGNRNLIDIAFDSRNVIFSISAFLIYFHYLFKQKAFQELFLTWAEVTKSLSLTKPDTTLGKTGKRIIFLVLTSMMIDNLMYISTLTSFHSSSARVDTLTDLEMVKMSWWKGMLYRIYKERPRIFPFSPLYVLFIFLNNIVSFYGWHFSDLIMILFGRGIGFKFTALVESSKKLYEEERFISGKTLRRDHYLLCSFVARVESFLSPLILLSFATNVYSLSLQIHDVVIPNNPKNFLEALYTSWFFFHLLLRMALFTYFGAKMNDEAQRIRDFLEKCDSREYCREKERLERYLSVHPVAFTGLNCFILTRSFVPMIFSLLFTIEIVLLQSKGLASPTHFGGNETRV